MGESKNVAQRRGGFSKQDTMNLKAWEALLGLEEEPGRLRGIQPANPYLPAVGHEDRSAYFGDNGSIPVRGNFAVQDQKPGEAFNPYVLSAPDMQVAGKVLLGRQMMGPPAPTVAQQMERWAAAPGQHAFPFPGAVGADGMLKDPPTRHSMEAFSDKLPERPAAGDGGGRAVPGYSPRKKPAGGGGGGGAAKGGGPLAGGGDPAGGRDPVPEVDELKVYKDAIKALEGDRKLDLSPLLALSDSWTGGNLRAGYNAPMSDEEREQIVMGLKERAAQKEADMRYKKSYLASMKAQDDTRILLKGMDNATQLERARIMAAGRNKGPSPDKVAEKLRRNNKGLLEQIAFYQHGDAKNPKNKDYKRFSDLVHQNLLEGAESGVESGDFPDMESAYQFGVMQMLGQKPRPQETEE